MKPLSFSFILLFLLLLSCKKEKLPKPTQKGANTFGCKIDGKIFIPKDVITVPVIQGFSSRYSETTKELRLSAVEPPNEKEKRLQRDIVINIHDLKIGDNKLDEISYARIVISEEYQLDKYYGTNSTTGGILNITRLDTNQNIISGTFSFVAAPMQINSLNVHVTEGRFDISY